MSIIRTKRAKLILASATLLVVGVVAIAVVTYWARDRQVRLLQQQETFKQQLLSINLGDSLKSDIDSTVSNLKLASHLNEIKGSNSTLCIRKVEELNASIFPRLGNMVRVNNKGIISCSLNKEVIGKAGSSFGSYIPNIFADPQHLPVMSPAISVPGASDLVVAVHVPVSNAKGEFDGSLGGAIYLSDLHSRYLDNIKLSPNAYAVIVDDNGQLLHHPEARLVGHFYGDEVMRDYIGTAHDGVVEAFRKTLAEGARTHEFTVGNDRRIAGLSSVEVFPGRKWVIWVVAPASDIQRVTSDSQTVATIISLIISLILLLALFAVAIVTYVFISILNPVVRVAHAARDIGEGDFSRRVPYDGDDEVGQLAQAFNAMAARLKDSYDHLEVRASQKTQQLAQTIQEMEQKNALLEKTKQATLNVLDDLASERSRAEKDHLRDEAIVASVGEGLIITNEYGKITAINPIALETLGFDTDASKTIGKGFISVVKAVDEKGNAIDPFDRPITKALETGKAVTATSFFQKVDGTIFPVFIAVSPIVLGGKPIGAVEVFRDITKERELEKAKEEFVSLASHQLRTPATGVKAFTSMLLDGYAGKLTPKQQEFLNKAIESNERQLGIIDDMLNVARADSGRMVLALESVDLDKMIGDIVIEQQATITERQQTITVKKPEQPVKIVADASKIRMVIENLVSNASKYTPTKGSLSLEYGADAKHVVIKVSDTGVGIAKKDLNKLFKKFSRIDNPLSTVVGGTGLGLYLAHKIVELHHGSLAASSVIGKGTTFTLQLPLEVKVTKSDAKENPAS